MSFFDSRPAKKRKPFLKTVKDARLQLQKKRCANPKCRRQFNASCRPHFDHKNGKNWDNSLRNCQALCPNCHNNKSIKESRTRANKKARIKKENSRTFGFGLSNDFF